MQKTTERPQNWTDGKQVRQERTFIRQEALLFLLLRRLASIGCEQRHVVHRVRNVFVVLVGYETNKRPNKSSRGESTACTAKQTVHTRQRGYESLLSAFHFTRSSCSHSFKVGVEYDRNSFNRNRGMIGTRSTMLRLIMLVHWCRWLG